MLLKQSRGGYKQIPISAGKKETTKVKKIDIACTLCAGANHGTFNQTYNYVLVVNENQSKERNKTRFCLD